MVMRFIALSFITYHRPYYATLNQGNIAQFYVALLLTHAVHRTAMAFVLHVRSDLVTEGHLWTSSTWPGISKGLE